METYSVTWKEIEAFVKKYQLEQCLVRARPFGSLEFYTPKKDLDDGLRNHPPIAELRTYWDKYVCKYAREYVYKGQIVKKEILGE